MPNLSATPTVIPFYQVDAFTQTMGQGNSAAVCLLDTWLPDQLLQRIAAENNLSETAFCVPRSNLSGMVGANDGTNHGINHGDNIVRYDIRWFTPTVEVELCGHATLATAHVLFAELGIEASIIHFTTQCRGVVTVANLAHGYRLDLPSNPAVFLPVDKWHDINPITAALGLTDAQLSSVAICDNVLLHLVDVDAVAEVTPDFIALAAALPDKGVIITAAAGSSDRLAGNIDSEPDFVSRYFAPAFGINEDPVTGSAHATLAPYWAEQLSQTTLVAQQISTRGGDLLCHVEDSRVDDARVLIDGAAVTVIKGQFYLPAFDDAYND